VDHVVQQRLLEFAEHARRWKRRDAKHGKGEQE